MVGLLKVIQLPSAAPWIGGAFYAYVILRLSVRFLTGPERVTF